MLLIFVQGQLEDEDAAMMCSSRFCHLSGENDEDDEMNADDE